MRAKQQEKRMWRRYIALLPAFVMLFTMNRTMMKADTLERIEICGLAERAHTTECYDAEGELTSGLVEHMHIDACPEY